MRPSLSLQRVYTNQTRTVNAEIQRLGPRAEAGLGVGPPRECIELGSPLT